MASSLFVLLDDIATVLDDIALLTKVAAKKTSGVLGDDLALNAQQVAGVAADRELPVVWAVAKGSAVNKLILVPLALLISALAPWLVMPLLMIGGAYLCFEGCEKIFHKFLHKKSVPETDAGAAAQRLNLSPAEVLQIEKEKIKGAIRTDFVLSAEIVTITLGTVASATLMVRVGVLAGVSALMTVGVYGLVAGIVKLDDLGFLLLRREQTAGGKTWLGHFGRGILKLAPWLMKGLGIAGTVAMFLVGGGIIAHGIPPVHHLIEAITANLGFFKSVSVAGLQGIVGLFCGSVVLAGIMGVQRLRGKPSRNQ